jgi:hypothetical protein
MLYSVLFSVVFSLSSSSFFSPIMIPTLRTITRRATTTFATPSRHITTLASIKQNLINSSSNTSWQKYLGIALAVTSSAVVMVNMIVGMQCVYVCDIMI